MLQCISCPSLQVLLHAPVQREGVSPGGGHTLLDLDTLELLEAAQMEGGGCGGREGSLAPPGGGQAEVRLRLGGGLMVVNRRAVVTGRVLVVTVMRLEIFSKHQTPETRYKS